jgi:hypothetical protein
LNSGNACYHSVQNIFSSCLLSKSIKIRIYKTIILPMVLYGCETWSLTLREEHRVLRRIFGLKRDEVKGDWKKLHNHELHKLYSTNAGMSVHSSCRDLARAVGDVVHWGLERNRCSNSSHRCSTGFRSRLWAGQSISETLLSTKHTLTYLILWQGAMLLDL